MNTVAPAKHEAVRATLAAVLGTASPDAVMPISGGASGAQIFRIDAAGKQLVLRVEGVPSPLRNPHQYVSQRIAAEAGVAPRIFYIDEEAGIAVTSFIVQQPLHSYPGGSRALAGALGGLLRQVQAMPDFPIFVDYPDIVARLFAHVRQTGLFAEGLLDLHWERLSHIRQTLVWDPASLVSSHNDPVPRNVLFDGERLWLIDWESAYRNDPLVDVAIMLDNLAPTPELQAVLLHAWLGRAPETSLVDRLAMIRALTRLYYAGVLLSASATQPRTAPDDDLSVPTRADFERTAREKPGVPEIVHVMGKMYLAGFLSGEWVPPLGAD
jgi:hypothetical protein